MKKYWYTKEVDLTFEEALDSVTFALLEAWFWILTQIDVQEKMKEKIWKEMEDYIILWACNPNLAYDALQNEIEIWLLLPCNVIVYKKSWKVFVSCIVPTVAMGSINNSEVLTIAEIAEWKLKKAIDSL